MIYKQRGGQLQIPKMAEAGLKFLPSVLLGVL